MPRYVEGSDRDQVTLLPECLDDYIAEDNGRDISCVQRLVGWEPVHSSLVRVTWPVD